MAVAIEVASKISTPSKPAAAAAVSFSSSPPLRQTVAIDVRMGALLCGPASVDDPERPCQRTI